MAMSLKKQRVIDTAGELMDVGDALDQEQDLHRRRAESLMAIATMLRADAILETRVTAGASWTPPGNGEDSFIP